MKLKKKNLPRRILIYNIFLILILNAAPFVLLIVPEYGKGLVLITLGVFYLLNCYFFFISRNSIFNKTRSDSQLRISSFLLFFLPASWFTFIRISFISKRKTELLEQTQIEQDLETKNTNVDVKLLNSGIDKFNKLFDDIKSAKKFINIQYFILNEGLILNELVKLLKEKADEGVIVTVLTDYSGNLKTEDKYYDIFKHKNIVFKTFNKVSPYLITGDKNIRSHNKIVVIDNKYGYTGGFNIGDDYASSDNYYGRWEDLHVRLEGEFVKKINETFLRQYNLFFSWDGEMGGEIQKRYNKLIELNEENIYTVSTGRDISYFEDGPQYSEPIFYNYLLNKIKSATKSIRLVSPYFVVPSQIIEELSHAINRGVEVTLVTAGRADKKGAYRTGEMFTEKLVSKGAKVYRVAHTFLHSKFYIFDESEVIFGTSNTDYRSIYYHIESNIIFKDYDLVIKFNNLCEEYKEKSFFVKKGSGNWGLLRKIRYLLVKQISTIY